MESHEVLPYHDQLHNPHVVPTALEEFQAHSGRPLSMDVYSFFYIETISSFVIFNESQNQGNIFFKPFV